MYGVLSKEVKDGWCCVEGGCRFEVCFFFVLEGGYVVVSSLNSKACTFGKSFTIWTGRLRGRE